jgi:hypothetical protein
VDQDRDIPAKILYTTEVGAVFCFDFSRFPEVLSGGTLSAPAVPAVSGVTIGSPAVLTADFYEGPTTGPVAVASGKGVKVTLASTTVGRYTVACNVLVTMPDASTVTRTKRLLLDVR